MLQELVRRELDYEQHIACNTQVMLIDIILITRLVLCLLHEIIVDRLSNLTSVTPELTGHLCITPLHMLES